MWVVKRKTDFFCECEDSEGWRSASLKKDGCIDYCRIFNVPLPIEDDSEIQIIDSLHICDIEEEIEYLKSLKKVWETEFK